MVKGLSGAHVDRFVTSIVADVIAPELRKRLPAHYAERQIRLHLPAYSAERIRRRPSEVASQLKGTLASRFLSTATSPFPLRSTPEQSTWRFAKVSPRLGLSIQRTVHYMHCPRPNTLLHYGAFQSAVPSIYMAFSPCDRDYLWSAVVRHLSERGLPAPTRDSTVVLTRVAATCSLPRNLVSMTLARAARHLQEAHSTHLCVTAVNPFLGFDGASVRSSGFTPFALSPMTYLYGSDLIYLTRRAATSGVIKQQLRTPPIVWHIRPVSRRYRDAALISKTGPLMIDRDRYEYGAA
ncbi:hypothetical protein ACFV28_28465 [Streptomyces sp. NPDC059720]|uniref:hypothetical protein n=1 Tax=Streptomyces sp. NPDC059720 TaxID=3346924 RepID=UPI00368B9347